MPMLSPMTYTSTWSLTVRGFVRKKKASVRWKSEMETMMVLAAMSGMAGESVVRGGARAMGVDVRGVEDAGVVGVYYGRGWE